MGYLEKLLPNPATKTLALPVSLSFSYTETLTFIFSFGLPDRDIHKHQQSRQSWWEASRPISFVLNQYEYIHTYRFAGSIF